jgi:hypothetical protein
MAAAAIFNSHNNLPSVQLQLLVYLVPLASFMPFLYTGNDVVAISAARGRLGVPKMADSESSTPVY